MTRKTSSVVTPSFCFTVPEIRQEEIDDLFSSTQETTTRLKRSLAEASTDSLEDSEGEGEMLFHISNAVPSTPTPADAEHLKTVPVDNLEHVPHGLAQISSMGVKRKFDGKRK